MQDEPVALHWAKVNNGEIIRCEVDLPRFDSDFAEEDRYKILQGAEDVAPITEDNAEDHGWQQIANPDAPSYDALTQAIDLRPTVTMVDGIPTADWNLRSFTSDEIAANSAAYNEAQRENRRRAFAMDWDSLAGKQKRGETVDDGSGNQVVITDQMLADTATEIRARYPYR